MWCDSYQKLTGTTLLMQMARIRQASIATEVSEILRFPSIVQNSGRVLWELELQKFSGLFEYDAWDHAYLISWKEVVCHMDAMLNFVLWYDWVPICYVSFGCNNSYTIIQTLQWVWKNPKRISEFDWQATLVWMVEQFSQKYFPANTIGIIKSNSHPFGRKLGESHYENIATRLGFYTNETIERPHWLLYYEGNEIDILSKHANL